MTFFDRFYDFYSSLESADLLLLWTLIFLSLFFFILCICLIYKNRRLNKLLLSIEEKNIVIEDVKEEPKEITKKDTKVEIEDIDKEELKGPYSKNILREIKDRQQTSPIDIKRDKVNIDELNDYTREINFEKNNDYEDDYYDNINKENVTFVEEISEKLEKELEPKTIELTDYEKKQEEEAIISYQELLSKKDKLYNITEEEETEEFIDELKNFRLDLE